MAARLGESSTLPMAAQWLEGLVQGPLAISVAVIAVAAAGMMMLSGRLAMRRGLMTIVGCFILFGASTIAKGLYSSALQVSEQSEPVGPSVETQLPSLPQPEPAKYQVADPYAGASLAR